MKNSRNREKTTQSLRITQKPTNSIWSFSLSFDEKSAKTLSRERASGAVSKIAIVEREGNSWGCPQRQNNKRERGEKMINLCADMKSLPRSCFCALLQ
jgi:hypothetical protein